MTFFNGVICSMMVTVGKGSGATVGTLDLTEGRNGDGGMVDSTKGCNGDGSWKSATSYNAQSSLAVQRSGEG